MPVIIMMVMASCGLVPCVRSYLENGPSQDGRPTASGA